jgi:hypothetical protein
MATFFLCLYDVDRKGVFVLSKKIGSKVIIYFLIILLIGSSVLPGFASKAQAAPPELFLDPLLEEWLPGPSGTPDYSQNF